MTKMSKMSILTKRKNRKSNFDCFVYLQNRKYPCKWRVNFHLTGPLIQGYPNNRNFCLESSTPTRWRVVLGGRDSPNRHSQLQDVCSRTVVTPSLTSVVRYSSFLLPSTSNLHMTNTIVDLHMMASHVMTTLSPTDRFLSIPYRGQVAHGPQ